MSEDKLGKFDKELSDDKEWGGRWLRKCSRAERPWGLGTLV